MSFPATDAMLKRRAAKAGKQLAHRHLSTTSIYLNHLAPEDVIAAGRADAWTPG